MKHTILCVDDEPDNVDALERLFRREYRVLKAHSGQEALDLLQNEEVSLIISDQRMPGITGVEFLAESMKTHPEAMRFLLTGYTDIDSVIEAVNSGQIYRYLTKPWDPADLTNTVNKAIERYELGHELKQKNEALESALKELKTLDAAKNQFMVLINHELKTPLTVMTSFLDLLAETSLDEEQSKYINRIQSSNSKLLALINDVLQLVSAEAGVLPVANEAISLQEFFDSLAARSAKKAEGNNQTFTCKAGPAKVKADRKILTTVVERLLDNAVKFGEKDSVIELLATPLDKENSVLIEISNEGPSIPEDIINQIMKPFTLNEEMMNHSKGFGLGLSLAQALLKHIGSHLKFSSSNGKVVVSFTV